MRVGVADHLGWAVVVTASDEHRVVDRRRIELVESGTAWAPIHHEGKGLDDRAAAALVAEVRASALRATSSALETLAGDLGQRIVSMSIRALPSKFPDDIATLRRTPYESRADAVMYRRVLAGLARSRGWDLHFYNAKTALAEAERILGSRTTEVLHGPRRTLGPPWTKDHRVALAATVEDQFRKGVSAKYHPKQHLLTRTLNLVCPQTTCHHNAASDDRVAFMPMHKLTPTQSNVVCAKHETLRIR